MLPGGIAKAAPYTATQYAKAVKVASGGAFLSAKYLEFYFGVTATASEAMVDRLISDGILANTGLNGVMFSKAYNASPTPAVAKLVHDVSAARARSDAAALKKRALEVLEEAEDAPGEAPLEAIEEETEAEIPSDEQIGDANDAPSV